MPRNPNIQITSRDWFGDYLYFRVVSGITRLCISSREQECILKLLKQRPRTKLHYMGIQSCVEVQDGIYFSDTHDLWFMKKGTRRHDRVPGFPRVPGGNPHVRDIAPFGEGLLVLTTSDLQCILYNSKD